MVKKSILILFAIIVAFLLMEGCTIIGYGMGKMGDASSPRGIDATKAQLVALTKDTPVKIVLLDREEISGKFIGFKNMLFDEYKKEYETMATKKEINDFPGINSALKLYMGDKIYNAELCGFDFSYIQVIIYDFGDRMRLPLSSVDSIVFNGNSFSGGMLTMLVDEGILPAQRLMVIDCGSHRKYLYMHNIDKAQYFKKPYSGKMVGGLLGMIFDILVLTTAL